MAERIHPLRSCVILAKTMHHSLDAAFGKCKEMYCNTNSLIYCIGCPDWTLKSQSHQQVTLI